MFFLCFYLLDDIVLWWWYVFLYRYVVNWEYNFDGEKENKLNLPFMNECTVRWVDFSGTNKPSVILLLSLWKMSFLTVDTLTYVIFDSGHFGRYHFWQLSLWQMSCLTAVRNVQKCSHDHRRTLMCSNALKIRLSHP